MTSVIGPGVWGSTDVLVVPPGLLASTDWMAWPLPALESLAEEARLCSRCPPSHPVLSGSSGDMSSLPQLSQVEGVCPSPAASVGLAMFV